MNGPFEMVGEVDAPLCVDGVCALPTDADEAVSAAADTASTSHHI